MMLNPCHISSNLGYYFFANKLQVEIAHTAGAAAECLWWKFYSGAGYLIGFTCGPAYNKKR